MNLVMRVMVASLRKISSEKHVILITLRKSTKKIAYISARVI